MTGKHADLYAEVIAVTSDYLGPAAPRFIDRQIANHLSKIPGQLTPKDMPVLINWMRSALALLTEDSKIVSEFTERLRDLTTTYETKDVVIK